MFVKEFGQVSATELNQQLSKVYRWQLNLNQISESDATNMLQTLGNKITAIKSSSGAHRAEKNPEFMEAIMVSKILETWKNEMSHDRRMIAERMRKLNEFLMISEDEMSPSELKKREHFKTALEKKRGEFKKRYGKRGDEVMYATATKMAKNESFELPPALTESEVEQARVTMATRDLADSVQDLVSKISDMQNEKLPALVTAMKDEIGMDQATAFNSTASSSLSALLDAANAARDALDNASRGQYGQSMGGEEQAPAPELGGAPMERPRPQSNIDAADVATGGQAELGRGRRV